MSYAPSIRRAAAELGLTPSEYLAQQEAQRGAGTVSGGTSSTPGQVGQQTPGTGGRTQQGLDAVAPVFDPVSGDWYYVRAESIDGQQQLENSLNNGGSAYAPGAPVANALNDMNVEHVPVLGANGPQADGTGLNQQQVREQQQVLPGTTMETNFPRPGSSPGIVNPPPRPDAPPAPEQPRPRYVTPGTTAPKLDASPNTGGQRAAGLVTGSRSSLDVFISPDSPGASIAGLTLKPRR